MLRLRLLHLRAQNEPGFVEPNPVPAMKALAREFPGALRELDELPLDVVRARIAELDEAQRDPMRIATWMRASSSFHRLARGALAAKRWLAGRADEDRDARRAAFVSASAMLDDEGSAAAWGDALDMVDRPPRGRVMDLVHARVAEELGLAVDEVRSLLGVTKKRRS